MYEFPGEGRKAGVHVPPLNPHFGMPPIWCWRNLNSHAPVISQWNAPHKYYDFWWQIIVTKSKNFLKNQSLRSNHEERCPPKCLNIFSLSIIKERNPPDPSWTHCSSLIQVKLLNVSRGLETVIHRSDSGQEFKWFPAKKTGLWLVDQIGQPIWGLFFGRNRCKTHNLTLISKNFNFSISTLHT